MLWPSNAANFNTLFDLGKKKDKRKNNPKLLNFYIMKYAKTELHFVYFLGLFYFYGTLWNPERMS